MNTSHTKEELRERLALVIEDIGDYYRNQERYSEPLKIGELTFEEQLMQLFQETALSCLIEPKYSKLSKCPYCGDSYQYACTCITGATSLYAGIKANIMKLTEESK